MQAALGWDDPPRTLPVAGFEVEGTSPSTKTMTADVVNLVALGVRLGFLVVSQAGAGPAGERDIYGRAARVVRTMRLGFGDAGVVATEWIWFQSAAEPPLSDEPHSVASRLAGHPEGGERVAWIGETRDALRAAGQAAGFAVVEPYEAPSLRAAYARGAGTRAQRGWRKVYTASKLDMAWLLPLPRGLEELLRRLAARPEIRDERIVSPEVYDHLPVVVFEFESSPGKHAAGGLANLSAYGLIGLEVVNGDAAMGEARKVLRRYQPTLGLPNVRVRAASELRVALQRPR